MPAAPRPPARTVARTAAVGLCVTGLAWAGLGSAPASATTRGADGLVAFVTPGGALATVDLARGGSPRTLVAGPVSRPRFNPYGKRIAYADRTGTLRSVLTAGGGARVLWAPGTSGARADAPTWAPPSDGGQRIAFVRTPAGGRADVWLQRTDEGAGVGAATRLTRESGSSCGAALPDWSPDGARIAYVRTLRNAAGTCRAADGALGTQFVVRDLAKGTSTVLPPVPVSQGSQPTGPVRFTADGAALTVGLSSDADGSGCTSTWLQYEFGPRRYSGFAHGNACDSGTVVDEVVPTPSGGKAGVYDDFTLDDEGGYTTWTLSATTGSRSVDGGRKPWSELDVQPRPAG